MTLAVIVFMFNTLRGRGMVHICVHMNVVTYLQAGVCFLVLIISWTQVISFGDPCAFIKKSINSA